jgi:hypothetical protein
MCRDGGLRENNPVQIAVDESKAIWGADRRFDMILSVGSGRAKDPPSAPSTNLLPSWLKSLVHTLLMSMDGDDAWSRFIRSAEKPVRSHTRRLNVQFEDERAPSLDDVTRIEEMRRAATNYDFKAPDLSHNQDSIIPPVSDGILEIALRIRASLFFFEPTSIGYNSNRDIIVIKGCICCRLGPGMEHFNNLLSLTEGFQVKESFIPCSQHASEAFRVYIDFREEIYLRDEQVRIDVRFTDGEKGYLVPISGFPMTLRVSSTVLDLRQLEQVSNIYVGDKGF